MRAWAAGCALTCLLLAGMAPARAQESGGGSGGDSGGGSGTESGSDSGSESGGATGRGTASGRSGGAAKTSSASGTAATGGAGGKAQAADAAAPEPTGAWFGGGEYANGMPRLSAPLSGVSPRTGFGAALGSVLGDFGGGEGAVPAANGRARAWTIGGAIGLDTTWSDRPGYGGGYTGQTASGDDVVFGITPSLSISHPDGPISVQLGYSPRAEIYARHSGDSHVLHDLNGDAQAELWPGWLYGNLRTSANEQSLFGGSGAGQTALLAPQNRQSNYSLAATPFIAHRFAGIGTLQLGYGYIFNTTEAPDQEQLINLGPLFPGGPDAFYPLKISGTSILRTQRGFATFSTGDGLGRLQTQTSVDANYYQGTGALGGAKRLVGQEQLSYALTRRLSLVGSGGYENLDYPRIDFRYKGPIGAGGVSLRPDADSKITVQYRYMDGEGGLFARIAWQITPRIRIFGGYSKGIGTDLEDQQTALLSDDADARGLRGSVLSAGPLLGDAGFGADSQVRRTQRLDLSAAYAIGRNSLSFGISRDQTTPVGTPLAGSPVAQAADSISANAGWQRQLREDLTLALNGGYTTAGARVAGVSDADTLNVSAGLSKNFARGLRLALRYDGRFALRASQGGNEDTQNSVTLSIGQAF